MHKLQASYKQVILVREDLKLEKGKLAAQVAHGSLEAAFAVNKKIVSEWMGTGAKKIVLRIADEDELLSYKRAADKAKLPNALIRDAGLTVLKPGTITCLAIGPDREERIDAVTGSLKPL